jgi:hypothetical protein
VGAYNWSGDKQPLIVVVGLTHYLDCLHNICYRKKSVPSENGSNRLDRIERALELLLDDHVLFREEHKHLLTAQVLLTDSLAKLVEAQKATEQRLTERLADLAEAGKHTDERLNALINVVDDLVRKRPPQ